MSKADELRESLRNARNGNGPAGNDTGSTSTSGERNDTPGINSSGDVAQEYVGVGDQQSLSGRHSTQSDVPGGSSSVRGLIQSISGSNSRARSNVGTVPGPKGKSIGGTGSSTQNDRRVGSQPGRPSENNSTYRTDGTDLRTRPGTSQSGLAFSENEPTLRLVRTPGDESYIPPRRFDTGTEETTPQPVTEPVVQRRKRGRPPKQRVGGNIPVGQISFAPNQTEGTPLSGIGERAKEFVAHITPTGQRLSKEEVKSLHDPLVSALTDEFEMLDKLLWGYGGDTTQQPIWSDISDNEMEAFVSAFLGLGQKSGTVATMARSAVDISDYVVVGAMLAPRVKKTVSIMRQHRVNRPSRKGRLQNANFNQ